MSTKSVVAATRDANNNQIMIGDLVHFIFERVVAATRDANNNQIIIGDLVHFILEGIYGTKGHEKKIIYAISGMSFNMVKVTTTSGRKRTWNIPSNTVVIINTASARELLVREQSINDRKKNRSLASKTSNKGSHKIEKP